MINKEKQIETTREEYNKALDIVEAYHKQLFIGNEVNIYQTKRNI